MPFFQNKSRSLFTVYNLFLLAAVILFIGVRLRHINMPFERDEGEYTYAAQEILKGGLPYKDFYNMKMPGVYYFMAFLFRFFGDSVYTVKLSLILVNFTAAFFIFLAAEKLFGKDTGKSAAAIYLLLCMSFSAQGWTANAEHYVIMFASIGLYFTALARQQRSNFNLFIAGVFMMLAMICKQHGIGFLIFPGLWFVYEAVVSGHWSVVGYRNPEINGDVSHQPAITSQKLTTDHRRPTTDKQLTTDHRLLTTAKKLFFYGLGCAVPFFGMLFYFWHDGILPNFYFLTFKYADAYGSLAPPLINIWHFRAIFWDNFGFWFIFFALIYFGVRKKIRIYQYGFFPILFLCSFVSISLGWIYRPHYFQLLFPAAAMMSGYAIVNIKTLWQYKWLTPSRYIVFAFLGTCALQYEYFFTSSSDKVMWDMYRDSYFGVEKTIGTQINTLMTDPKEKIGIVGCEPEIFYYSKRQSASGFIYVYPILESQRYAGNMFKQFAKEIETAKPEILIYVQNINDASLNLNNIKRLNTWFEEYSKGYNIVAQAYVKNGKPKIDWQTDNKMYAPMDSTIALIYKRK